MSLYSVVVTQYLVRVCLSEAFIVICENWFFLKIFYFSICLTSDKFNTGLKTNSPTFLLDFIRRRVGVGELTRRRLDWIPFDCRFYAEWTTYTYSEIVWAWIPFETYNILLQITENILRSVIFHCPDPLQHGIEEKKYIKKNDKCCEWWYLV